MKRHASIKQTEEMSAENTNTYRDFPVIPKKSWPASISLVRVNRQTLTPEDLRRLALFFLGASM